MIFAVQNSHNGPNGHDSHSRSGRPVVIAGPCGAESREQVLDTALRLKNAGVEIFRAGVWKPRTKPGGFEGRGDRGLEWLAEVKRQTGMYTAVEVATPRHIEAALKARVDILWVGARTSADPFAVQEIAEALKGNDISVLVKNPVNPDIELWTGAIQRLYNAGIRRLGAIHRGFSEYRTAGYRNTPLWSIPIELHRRLPRLPLFCDPSHMGGRRDLIGPLAQQAMDLGFDGLFVEAHSAPDEALSDSMQQITPEELRRVLDELVIRDADDMTAAAAGLDGLRGEIDALDDELLALLARRMAVARDIGRYKREHSMSVLQARRYDALMSRREREAQALGLDGEFVKAVLRTIHEESVQIQMKLVNQNDEKADI